MSKEVVILIIAHKQFLTEQEKLSLKQCYRILGKYPIKIICPEGLDISIYKSVNRNADIVFIDPQWQSDYESFNRLKIDDFLLKKFKDFTFILFYELDAFVFRDELKLWCDKGYDYIGAPWTGFKNYKSKPLLGVGNGGFSLRNVSRSLKVLRTLRLFEVLYSYRLLDNISIIPRLPIILKKLMNAHKFESKFEKDYRYFEDIFWCKGVEERVNSTDFNSSIVKRMVKFLVRYDFKIAPAEIASRFSVEVDPQRYYEVNNKELPFGCHAWGKYEPEFWKEFIPAKVPDL